MFCSKCGNKILDESLYCNFCGNKVEVFADTKEKENNKIKNENIKQKEDIDTEKEKTQEAKPSNAIESKEEADEVYKVCPNCGKLIKWKERACSYCGAPVHEPQFQQIRGGLAHPVISGKNFQTAIRKRPISVVLVALLGAAFLITLLALIASNNTLLAIIIYFPIFIIITFSLIFINLRKIKSRSLSFLITTCVLLVILIISSVALSNIQNKKNIAKATTQSTEKTNVTAAEASETLKQVEISKYNPSNINMLAAAD